MPLSLPEIERGAKVAHSLDPKGKRRPVSRVGHIIKIVSQSGEEKNDGSGVKEIHVLFAKGTTPEVVPNQELTLVKSYDRVAAESMRLRDRNEKAKQVADNLMDERVVADAPEPLVTWDETDIHKPIGGPDVDKVLEAGPASNPAVGKSTKKGK